MYAIIIKIVRNLGLNRGFHQDNVVCLGCFVSDITLLLFRISSLTVYQVIDSRLKLTFWLASANMCFLSWGW